MRSSGGNVLLLTALLACASGVGLEETETPDTQEVDTGEPARGVGLQWRLHEEIESLVYATWVQPVAATGHVEYSVDEGEWMQAPSRSYDQGPQEELLLGIPYGMDAEIRVVWDESTGEPSRAVTARTGSIPEARIVPVLLESVPELQQPDTPWLLGSINKDEGGWNEGEYWMFVLDRKGRLVWAHRGERDHFTIYLHPSLDGDILWDVCTWWSAFDQGAGSLIHRMKIDGTITATYPAPGMHHTFTELPDRSILWGSADSQSESIMRLHPDGSTEEVWDCRDFYPEVGIDPDTDWCHTNSLYYSPQRDTLLLSFPTDRTFVLEVDLQTGEELRWFGHIPGSWSFDPPESAFRYQHGVTWTPEGHLLASSQRSASSIEGVVREYSLDEASSTLHLEWSHGEGDGIDARYAGEAHRLPGGNTLHNTGTTPRIREITPDGQVVWDLKWSGYRLLGRTVFLEDLYTLAP